MESSIRIEERAAQWLARRDGDSWGERDQAAFDAWLQQSTAHVVAFVRLEAAWLQAKRLKALNTGEPGVLPVTQEWQPESSLAGDPSVVDAKATQATGMAKKRTRYIAAIAASVVLVVALGIVAYSWQFGSSYRTPVGGVASVPLADGSKVTLNTDSKVRLAIDETERRILLDQGEAYFEVAKDPARPFVVDAGTRRVVAVGTKFSVRRENDEVRVVITEGRVRIEDDSETAARSNDTAPYMLAAGNVARATDAGVLVEEHTVADVETQLSWRTGHLIFRNTPLGEAIAEFNRYNTRQIVIDDPDVAGLRVSGKFRSTQFEAFVRLLEAGFPVSAERVDDRIVLTHRQER